MHHLHRKKATTEKSLAVSIVFGIIVFFLLLMLAVGGTSFLIYHETIRVESGFTIILILNGVSAFGGSLVAYAMAKRRRLLLSFITSVGAFSLLMTISALMFSGKYDRPGLHFLAILSGCSLYVLLALFERKKKYH